MYVITRLSEPVEVYIAEKQQHYSKFVGAFGEISLELVHTLPVQLALVEFIEEVVNN